MGIRKAPCNPSANRFGVNVRRCGDGLHADPGGSYGSSEPFVGHPTPNSGRKSTTKPHRSLRKTSRIAELSKLSTSLETSGTSEVVPSRPKTWLRRPIGPQSHLRIVIAGHGRFRCLGAS